MASAAALRTRGEGSEESRSRYTIRAPVSHSSVSAPRARARTFSSASFDACSRRAGIDCASRSHMIRSISERRSARETSLRRRAAPPGGERGSGGRKREEEG